MIRTSPIQPQWTARMYPGTVGRDHLGLGSVSSFQILASLASGINVLTKHPRYHSFYVFLLDEFWRRERPKTRAEWIRFYRPRAFAYSIATHLKRDNAETSLGSIIGGQKLGPLVAEGTEEFDLTFNYIKTESGGYGLYYRSVMIEMGLVYPGGRGFPYPIDVQTEKGKEVAASFRQAVAETEYYRNHFEKDSGTISREVLSEYGEVASLDLLQFEDAPDRPALLDIFLHGGAEANSRRETFRFFLDIAKQTNGTPMGEDEFRQLIYFYRSLNGASYTPIPDTEFTARKWRLYQMREYYAFALNALWAYLSDWGIRQDGHLRPISLSNLWEHVDSGLDFQTFFHECELPETSIGPDSDFQSLLNYFMSLAGVSNIEAFDNACTLSFSVHEHILYLLVDSFPENPVVNIAGMISMLSLIYLRVGYPERWQEPDWQIARMGSDGRLSIDQFVRTLNRKLRSGFVSIREISRWILEDYVILQHTLIASGKLPENTFRFRRDGYRLVFFDLPTAFTFNDSRFDSLSTTVYELGLCGDFSQSEHSLTDDGERLLSEGDLA